MAMKTERVLVPDGYGADSGKTFVVTAMSAMRAEKWAWRMSLAIKGTAGHIPLDLEESLSRLGIVGVAVRGVNAFLAAAVKFEEIEPLLDEMLKCVTVVRDPRHPDVATQLLEADIAEPRTVMWLRGEVLRVHVGFSPADVLSRLTSALETSASLNTRTSPP